MAHAREQAAERDGLDRAMALQLAARLHRTPLALEGGAVEVNGRGLMIANEELHRSRNPELSRAEVEHELLRLPGVRKVLWLPWGLAEDVLLRATITGPYVAWGAGGHTDEFVRFADERTVLLAWPDDADAAAHPVSHKTRLRMQRNLRVLLGIDRHAWTAFARDQGADAAHRATSRGLVGQRPVWACPRNGRSTISRRTSGGGRVMNCGKWRRRATSTSWSPMAWSCCLTSCPTARHPNARTVCAACLPRCSAVGASSSSMASRHIGSAAACTARR